jgi:large subunit ribosomal protein L22
MAEARAQKRSIQSSPRKMRLMLDLIRGKRVTEAISLLHFTPNHASIVAEQTLRSAIANFQLKPENSRFDIEDLYVAECYADGGPMLKRILPAPMGRAFRVRKRSNHLTIVVSNRPPKQALKNNTRSKKRLGAAAPAPKAAPAAPAAEAKKGGRKKKAEAAA